MISCTEFIPLYSEFFKFLEKRGGHDEVMKYWIHISDTGIGDVTNPNSLAYKCEKLGGFEEYDTLLKEMKEIYKENQRDREVFLKTLEMQAGQIGQLIDCSHLPQARKDAIFETYRSQLAEINKLKEENNDG